MASQGLGDGDEIMSYLHECVSKYGLEDCLNLSHRVVEVHWSSGMERWTIDVDHKGQSKTYVAKWLVLGTGPFDFEKPFPTIISGFENFQGQVLHLHFWPADYNYEDKNIVIIGSGATAITMLPAMVKNGAKKVTM